MSSVKERREAALNLIRENGQLIRGMTDDELVDFIFRLATTARAAAYQEVKLTIDVLEMELEET